MNDLRRALDAPLTSQRRRYDAEQGALIGGRCSSCGASAWPRRTVCYRCGQASIDDFVLDTMGSLVTWARVWVPTDEVDPPYVLGLVVLDGIELVGHVRGLDDQQFKVPSPVRLVVDPTERPPFWFEPATPRDDASGPSGDPA